MEKLNPLSLENKAVKNKWEKNNYIKKQNSKTGLEKFIMDIHAFVHQFIINTFMSQ